MEILLAKFSIQDYCYTKANTKKGSYIIILKELLSSNFRF